MLVMLMGSNVKRCLGRQDTVATMHVVEYEEGVGGVTRLAKMREEEERDYVDQI